MGAMAKTKQSTKVKSELVFNLFNFDFDKVMGYCKKLKKTEDKILYLEYVLKERKNDDTPDIEAYFGPSFEKKIKNEKRYLEKELKLKNPYKAEGYDKIVWAKNRQDFAALFDVLGQLGYITYRKNKWEVLSNHFTWGDEEMTAEHLRQALNNIKNKPETHQLSDEMKIITEKLSKKIM